MLADITNNFKKFLRPFCLSCVIIKKLKNKLGKSYDNEYELPGHEYQSNRYV